MNEYGGPTDFEKPIADLPAPVLAEYLTQLQTNFDRLTERSRLQRNRIEKLEADRETLRVRLDAARQVAKPRGLGRFRAKGGNSPPEGVVSEDHRDASAPIAEAPVRRELTVATILDPISTAVFAPEFRSVPLGRETWRTQLDEHEPDLLFVESAFSGINGEWAFRIAHFGEPHADLTDLVGAARDAGISTVFWNKEDPINYGMFIGSASLFDHVFTVDASTLDRYQRDLGHGRVRVLPFAAQPALHYPPANNDERTGAVAFAGSYYAKKHAERRVQMEMLLGPALDFDLDIFDRMGVSDDPRFAWPERFRSSIVGSVPYVEMGDVYRRYKVFLNVNTITDSPTMCARRVFELAATGTPIVSGPSDAIDAMVPLGIAHIAHTADETHRLLRTLLDQPEMRSKATDAGPAWIAGGNTYGDRVTSILESMA